MTGESRDGRWSFPLKTRTRDGQPRPPTAPGDRPVSRGASVATMAVVATWHTSHHALTLGDQLHAHGLTRPQPGAPGGVGSQRAERMADTHNFRIVRPMLTVVTTRNRPMRTSELGAARCQLLTMSHSRSLGLRRSATNFMPRYPERFRQRHSANRSTQGCRPCNYRLCPRLGSSSAGPRTHAALLRPCTNGCQLPSIQ